jgi:hypothetical protein
MMRALAFLAFIAPSFIGYAVYAAEPLGRLFYTPAQRAELDGLRSKKYVAPPTPEPEQPAAIPDVVKYDGIVRRSDGRTTVWINNRAVDDGKPAGELPLSSRVRADHRIRLTLPEAGKEIELRVGQSVDVVSGSIVEPYARTAPNAEAVKPAASPGASSAKKDVQRPARPDSDEENGERTRR